MITVNDAINICCCEKETKHVGNKKDQANHDLEKVVNKNAFRK